MICFESENHNVGSTDVFPSLFFEHFIVQRLGTFFCKSLEVSLQRSLGLNAISIVSIQQGFILLTGLSEQQNTRIVAGRNHTTFPVNLIIIV